MIREELKQLPTTPRDLRKFGLLVGGVFAAFGLVAWLRHKHYSPWPLGIGAGLILGGLLAPRALKWVYLAWMAFALVLGFIVSHVLLTLLFYLAVTPVGLLARCFGQDFLSLKLDPEKPSYWIKRDRKRKEKTEHERQF